jgi:hypothetical protein
VVVSVRHAVFNFGDRPTRDREDLSVVVGPWNDIDGRMLLAEGPRDLPAVSKRGMGITMHGLSPTVRNHSSTDDVGSEQSKNTSNGLPNGRPPVYA